ncbi:hypothetical protein AB0D32_09435 [Micromonospora sp. NPDC048170]|uniref:hypothetical protein n=1 Tax=Micromonospora sp. NPDC048170 TaxID=3154819 RepID=UPI0034117C21
MAGKQGPWYPKITGGVGFTDEEGIGRAHIEKGEEWWDPRLPTARPDLFADTKAEAMRPAPPTRTCPHCRAQFEVPTGPGAEKVYCDRKCRKGRETLLGRAGRIVGRPVPDYPTGSAKALTKWLEEMAETRRVVLELHGHLTDHKGRDGLDVARQAERRDLLLRKTRVWVDQADKSVSGANHCLAALWAREKDIRLGQRWWDKGRGAHAEEAKLQDSWSKLWDKLDPEGAKAKQPQPESTADDPGIY